MNFDPPHALVLAGINGAGKTTSSRAVLADALNLLTFVNADVIAQGLSGFDPNSAALEAGRVMLERLHRLAAKRENFAFETTLAARTYAGWLESLRQDGYGIHLFYFWLKSAGLAIERVASRVRAGGHHVPAETIRQRYSRSVRNFFELYRPLAATWRVYDNSDEYRLIAEGGSEKIEVVHDQENWDRIRQGAAHGR
jgi:predicted ABC-type ATPase